jgi:hypothetical protein
MGLPLTLLGVGLMVSPEHFVQQWLVGLGVAVAGVILAAVGK